MRKVEVSTLNSKPTETRTHMIMTIVMIAKIKICERIANAAFGDGLPPPPIPWKALKMMSYR